MNNGNSTKSPRCASKYRLSRLCRCVLLLAGIKLALLVALVCTPVQPEATALAEAPTNGTATPQNQESSMASQALTVENQALTPESLAVASAPQPDSSDLAALHRAQGAQVVPVLPGQSMAASVAHASGVSPQPVTRKVTPPEKQAVTARLNSEAARLSALLTPEQPVSPAQNPNPAPAISPSAQPSTAKTSLASSSPSPSSPSLSSSSTSSSSASTTVAELSPTALNPILAAAASSSAAARAPQQAIVPTNLPVPTIAPRTFQGISLLGVAHAAESIVPPPPKIKPMDSPLAADKILRPDEVQPDIPPAPKVTPLESRDSAQRKQEELNRREQELLNLQQQMESRVQELNGLENRIKGMINEADTQQDDKLKHLIDTYANMKPRQAATVLATLDEAVAVKILSGLKSRQAGEIFSYMPPDRAAVLSELLSKMQM